VTPRSPRRTPPPARRAPVGDVTRRTSRESHPARGHMQPFGKEENTPQNGFSPLWVEWPRGWRRWRSGCRHRRSRGGHLPRGSSPPASSGLWCPPSPRRRSSAPRLPAAPAEHGPLEARPAAPGKGPQHPFLPALWGWRGTGMC